MRPETIETTPPACTEALTEAGRLLVAEVSRVCPPAGTGMAAEGAAGVANWRRVWSTLEKAFGLWRDARPVGDLVIFDRIADQMDESEEEVDALVFGLLLGTFVEDKDVPAVEYKTQALVYLASQDLSHQTLGVDWLRAHSPATVKTLKFLLAEAVRTRTARSAGTPQGGTRAQAQVGLAGSPA